MLHSLSKTVLPPLFCLFALSVQAMELNYDSLEQALQVTDNDDEKFQIYRLLIWDYSRTKPQRALELNADLTQMAHRSENPHWLNQGRYYYGVIYKNMGENSLALSYLDSTLQYHRSQNDTKREAHTLYQIGVVNKNMGQIKKGIDAINATVEIYRKLDDTISMAMSINAKGYMFRQLHQHDRAIEMYREAYALHAAGGDTIGMAGALLNHGNAYKALHKLDSALILYNLSEKLSTTQRDEWGLGYIYENRGDLYHRMGDNDRAIKELNQSIVIRKKYQQKGLLVPTLLLLANVHRKQGDLAKARNEIDTALVLAKETNMTDHLKAAYGAMSQIYEDLGLVDLALEAFKKHNTIKDSLFNEKISQQFAELETLHKTREKEEQITQLAFQQELNQIRLSRQRDVILVFSIGAAVLLLLLWRYSALNKKVKQQNQLIGKALSEKEILLKEIHHRVKNNLQLISSLLSLQSSTIDDSTALAALTEGQSRVQSMALIHQDLYRSDNLTGVQIEGYIKKLCRNLFDTYNIRGERIRLQLEIAPLSLDVSTLIPLGLILNELISNSLKYAFPNNISGTIGVRLQPKEEKLLLEVWDDGEGFTPNARTNGFGHKLVKTFAKKLEADVSIDQKDGTIVSMQITNFKVA